MNTTTSTTDSTSTLARGLTELAHRLAADGVASEPDTVANLAGIAFAYTPGAAAALLDPTAGEVMRLRAFATIHGALTRDPAVTDAHQAAALAALARVVLAA